MKKHKMKRNLIKEPTWKKAVIPCGTHHNKTASKTTVRLYLSKNTVERARFHNLNLSRIAEQALISILDYLEPQNNNQSSNFLGTGSFLKEVVVVPRAGLEPATTRSSASPSTTKIVESSALPN